MYQNGVCNLRTVETATNEVLLGKAPRGSALELSLYDYCEMYQKRVSAIGNEQVFASSMNLSNSETLRGILEKVRPLPTQLSSIGSIGICLSTSFYLPVMKSSVNLPTDSYRYLFFNAFILVVVF